MILIFLYVCMKFFSVSDSFCLIYLPSKFVEKNCDRPVIIKLFAFCGSH